MNLNKLSATVAALILIILVAGCQDAKMRDKITRGEPVIMTDTEGTSYVVEHHIGNTYTVKPLKSVQQH